MTPQLKTLLTHLQKHATISQAEAGLVYKIRALPKRISELKDLGYEITRELKKDPIGQRYARYTLVNLKPTVTTEPRTDAPVVALNVKPMVGDKVLVVACEGGRYKNGDIGVVTGYYYNCPNKPMVAFVNRVADCRCFSRELEVIAHD